MLSLKNVGSLADALDRSLNHARDSESGPQRIDLLYEFVHGRFRDISFRDDRICKGLEFLISHLLKLLVQDELILRTLTRYFILLAGAPGAGKDYALQSFVKRFTDHLNFIVVDVDRIQEQLSEYQNRRYAISRLRQCGHSPKLRTCMWPRSQCKLHSDADAM